MTAVDGDGSRRENTLPRREGERGLGLELDWRDDAAQGVEDDAARRVEDAGERAL